MNLLGQIREEREHRGSFSSSNPIEMLEEDLSAGLSLYWSTAARILRGSGITLRDPSPEYLSLEGNFFSALFLYSYYSAEIPKQHRVLYAALNQCLRGMVTGCDNILDDEYKRTLETDLPEHGTKFRSVLDIMVSDRVLFEILINNWKNHGLTHDQILSASSASLRALAQSGAQEASEEDGIRERLEPTEVLRSVHHYKTGLLFQCPWAVPMVIEKLDKNVVSRITDALYQIGMGCQIMDDMVDLERDLRKMRHNYVASLIYYDHDSEERARLEDKMSEDLKEGSDMILEFPRARGNAAGTALDFLENGTISLFGDRHRFLVEPTILFLARRIGADQFMNNLLNLD